MVKCAAKLSHRLQLLAWHCHVSHSWRAASHLAPAWNHPQDTMFSSTALRASPCSGFLASCPVVPKHSKVWEWDRKSCRVCLSACVANGQTHKLQLLAWRQFAHSPDSLLLSFSLGRKRNHRYLWMLTDPFFHFAVAIDPVPEVSWEGLHNLTSSIYICACIPGESERRLAEHPDTAQLRGRCQELRRASGRNDWSRGGPDIQVKPFIWPWANYSTPICKTGLMAFFCSVVLLKPDA